MNCEINSQHHANVAAAIPGCCKAWLPARRKGRGLLSSVANSTTSETFSALSGRQDAALNVRQGCLTPRHRRAESGFTLAEVLAAMLFMAIVIPVAVAGLRIASLAGEVGSRKAVACRVADRVLNEALVTGQLQKSSQSGSVREGVIDYEWTLSVEPSGLDTLSLATVEVNFPAQGKTYDVNLSTLVDSAQ